MTDRAASVRGARRKAASADDKARRDFLANVRHELRTPINHIIGYSEMLQEEAEDEGGEDFVPGLERIQAAGKQLLELVNSSFDPAKFDASEESMGRVRRELRAPVDAIIGSAETLQREAQGSGDDHMVPDLEKICLAARNILAFVDDRLDFSEAGISQAALDEARSAIPDMARARRAAGADGDSSADEWTELGRILVVEDNEMSRDMLVRRLRNQGHTVDEAEDGRVALEMMRRTPFDLVLLDVMMPVMNGYEALEQAKSDPSLRHVPVIMLSALDEIDSVVRCIEMGAEDYLPKPFNSVLLRARIETSLEKKRLRDQEVLYLEQIEREKKRSDELLHVILPGQIVTELKATNEVRPRRYDNVAVMFCDIVGFTSFCDTHTPEEVSANLQQLIQDYEGIAERYHLQKIKTIGDSFMATAGLLDPVENPTLSCVAAGMEMIGATQSVPAGWNARVGVHFGHVMAGVVGHRRYLFDIWGDTVNTAARLESNGFPGYVNVSVQAWEQVCHCCRGESAGLLDIKGKGKMELIRVTSVAAR